MPEGDFVSGWSYLNTGPEIRRRFNELQLDSLAVASNLTDVLVLT